MTLVKKMVLTALCVAMAVALPMAFHAIPNAGSLFLPMHLPVLLCGLLCGAPYGLLCGALAPVLSSLLTAMPTAAMLPSMVCELAVYGLISGWMMHCLPIRRRMLKLYAAQIIAMLSGRLVMGLLNALIFKAGSYSLSLWLTSTFVTGLPGILLQLAVVPILLTVLEKARLIQLEA